MIGERRARMLDVVLSELSRLAREPRQPHQIDPDAPLFGTGLGLDSIDAVELVIALQESTGTQIPEGNRTRASLRTPNSLVDLLLGLESR